MLTIISCPKAFEGPFETIQRNAIKSWLKLEPKCEIILIGSDKGTAEVCKEFELKYFPDVECNEYGTPLMSSIFDIGQNNSKNKCISYINADIILFNDLVQTVQNMIVQMDQFLLVGRRWDVDIKKSIDFDTDWEEQIKREVAEKGILHDFTGIDCIVFTRGMLNNFPKFAIGRPLWDNYLIYSMQQQKIPVIDMTLNVKLVHQNHNYSHYKLGDDVWQGPEAKEHLKLAGGYRNAYTIADADYVLSDFCLRKNPKKLNTKLIRRFKTFVGSNILRDEKWKIQV